MNIGKFCPLPLCTLIGNSLIYLYIVSLVVILSNWVCDNLVYRFPKRVFLDSLNKSGNTGGCRTPWVSLNSLEGKDSGRSPCNVATPEMQDPSAPKSPDSLQSRRRFFQQNPKSEKSGCPKNFCPQTLVYPPPPKRAQNEEKLYKSVGNPQN